MAPSILYGCTGMSKLSRFAYVIISKSHELASIFVDFVINMLYITITDSSAYAHYVFNTFDHDRNGSISFEVTSKVLLVRSTGAILLRSVSQIVLAVFKIYRSYILV